MELIRIWSLSRAHIIFEVMIQFTKGNLLESDAQALVNTVNTEGVMGKGIALQFKEMFPENNLPYYSRSDGAQGASG